MNTILTITLIITLGPQAGLHKVEHLFSTQQQCKAQQVRLDKYFSTPAGSYFMTSCNVEDNE